MNSTPELIAAARTTWIAGWLTASDIPLEPSVVHQLLGTTLRCRQSLRIRKSDAPPLLAGLIRLLSVLRNSWSDG
ncbi:hypothetical protein [Paenibacillus sp. 843]|uniref:hypothetical protein n=1 Tax=Paenibacillus sp. 843 TaxID=3341795 RepID=UPI00372ADBC5